MGWPRAPRARSLSPMSPTAREPAATVRVAIVEDQEHLREGLALLVDGAEGLRATGRFASMEAALPALAREPADVLLCDIGLPGMSGIEGVRRLKSTQPALEILMLTVFGDDDHVFAAICAGASGYLL